MTESPIIFDAQGLIPAVVQSTETGAVIMLAYMNAEALRLTRETGKTHFWSRSRQSLWRKGEMSGNEQLVEQILVNCYADSLLIRVTQVGPGCHTDHEICYYRRLAVTTASPRSSPASPTSTSGTAPTSTSATTI
jgi:phosphoribosyl-AMP cyclohydrolase